MNQATNLETQALWRPPAELLRAIPRPSRLSAAGKLIAIFGWLLPAGAPVLGTWLYLQASGGQDRSRELRDAGIATQADIVRVSTTRGEKRRRVVSYRYFAAGHSYTGRQTLRRTDRRPFEAGSTIEVRFLPSQPQSSWMDGYGPRGMPSWPAVVLPLGLALCTLPMIYVIRRQRMLFEYGRPAQAVILESKRIHHSHGASHYRVRYEFQTLSGSTRKGSYNASRKPPAAGTAITVLYDPDEPKRSAPYPLQFIRLAKW